MRIVRALSNEELAESGMEHAFRDHLDRADQNHFFQSPEFLEFIQPIKGYAPVLFLAVSDDGSVKGSLLAVYQRDGGAIKSWLSKRGIAWGGPIGDPKAVPALLDALLKDAQSKAIFLEFRNFFDMGPYHDVFLDHGFSFNPHLNFLLPLGSEEEALKRMSGNRRRQIRSSVSAGADHGEARSTQEVRELYDLLADLYRSKVGKPLPSFELFERFHTSPSGKVFVVRYDGKVIGGSAGPVYKDRIIYQWYVCGDNSIKGVHASVLATWAQIEYGSFNGYQLFDFMGAGKPGQGYGVHEFKARFGGDEVAYGRYEKILNPGLYNLGVHGLKLSQRWNRIITKAI